MRKFKNIDWDCSNAEGNIATWQHVSIAVLMDIRDELQALNRVIGCQNFIEIPRTLRTIETNTKKRVRVVKAKK